MSKNLIPEIAKMLGVELGEKFEIKGYKGLLYKFTDDELIVNSTDDKGCSGLTANMTLVSLLKGEREIIKLPWQPKKDERYWMFTVRENYLESSSRTWAVRPGIWEKDPIDIALLDKGWVYRTREEAEAALPKVAAEMGVEYEL